MESGGYEISKKNGDKIVVNSGGTNCYNSNDINKSPVSSNGCIRLNQEEDLPLPVSPLFYSNLIDFW